MYFVILLGNVEQLLHDAKTWPKGVINSSQKARQYNIHYKNKESSPPNAGQILKKLLSSSKDINVSDFESPDDTKGNLIDSYL